MERRCTWAASRSCNRCDLGSSRRTAWALEEAEADRIALRPVAGLVDRAATRFVLPDDPPDPAVTGEPLTPASLVERPPSVAEEVRLAPDYDSGYLTWLFRALDDSARREPLWPHRVERGRLWAELVRTRGDVAGWYVCQLQRGGLCRVLQFAATPRKATTVLARLRQGALENGAAGIYGRLEPLLFGPLSEQRIFLRLGPVRLLVDGPRRRDRDRDRARRRAPEPNGRRVVVRMSTGQRRLASVGAACSGKPHVAPDSRRRSRRSRRLASRPRPRRRGRARRSGPRRGSRRPSRSTRRARPPSAATSSRRPSAARPPSVVARGNLSLMNITPCPTKTSSSSSTPSQTNVWLWILQFAPTTAPRWISTNGPIARVVADPTAVEVREGVNAARSRRTRRRRSVGVGRRSPGPLAMREERPDRLADAGELRLGDAREEWEGESLSRDGFRNGERSFCETRAAA